MDEECAQAMAPSTPGTQPETLLKGLSAVKEEASGSTDVPVLRAGPEVEEEAQARVVMLAPEQADVEMPAASEAPAGPASDREEAGNW